MPPAKTAKLTARRAKLLGPNVFTFYEEPAHIVRGEGVWLWDADGRRYLDCYNNVAHAGHCNPRVVEAICRQATPSIPTPVTCIRASSTMSSG